jgi:methyl-accepting chemotaxis protein
LPSPGCSQFSISLGYLRSAGARIFSSGREIRATIETSARADEQAASLNETFATTEELASAAQIAENAPRGGGGAQRTLAATVDGQGRAEQFHVSVLG